MSNAFVTATQRHLPILAIACTLLVSGCVVGPHMVTPAPPPIPNGGPPVPEKNKIVLADDTQVVADAGFGHIKIEAGPGLRRVFTWNDVRRGAIMKAREKPYLGSLGITYDAVPPVWKPAQGVTRLKYEEGQRNFENVDDARIWMQIRRLYYTYNNSGIAVGWRQQGSTLQVEVWQLYIDGKQPKHMAGAEDASITISPLVVVPQKMSPRLVSGRGKADSTGPKKQNWFQRTFGGLFGGDKSDDASADKADTPNKSNPPADAKNAPAKNDEPATVDKTENENSDSKK